MKKLLIGLFVFSFLVIGTRVYALDQFVTVTSPNDTNIALDQGQKIEIRWDSNVAINAMVDVYISDGTHKGPVVRGSNSGNLIYNPGILPAGSNYKAYVSIVSETPIGGYSDVPFIIRSAPVENVISDFVPSITVTSPNDSHIALDSGQKIEVRWDSNVAVNTMVDVYISNGVNKGPVIRGNNTGNLIYNPGILPAGSNYKAYVSLVSETQVLGVSEVPFTIRSSQNQTGCSNGEIYSSTTGQYCPNSTNKSEIKVLFPNGGETYVSDQQIAVKWINTNVSDLKVKINIYGDIGNNYGIVSSLSVANNGSATINLPSSVQFSNYIVKVESSSVSGSSGSFKINSANDNSCSNGQRYSSKTGQLCKNKNIICPLNMINPLSCPSSKTESYLDSNGCSVTRCSTPTSDLGCNGNHKFSMTTGQMCSNYQPNNTQINRTLRRGMFGEDVKILQRFLELNADGIYGRGTAYAVSGWQAENGLASDGTVGYYTRIKMGL